MRRHARLVAVLAALSAGLPATAAAQDPTWLVTRTATYKEGGGSSPRSFTAFGSSLYFAAESPSTGIELFRTDGSSTALVRDINAAGASGAPSELTVIGSRMFFRAVDPLGVGLYVTDGTTEGTVVIRHFVRLSSLTALGPVLLFQADDGDGTYLWKSDGTLSGTVQVSQVRLGGAYSPPMAVVGDRIYFEAQGSAAEGYELWTSDGTAAGTRLVRDLNPSGSSNPRHMAPFGNRLFFMATDGAQGSEPWVTDGTAAGTRLVRDLVPGSAGSDARPLGVLSGRLLFAGRDGGGRCALLALESDGATVTSVHDVGPAPGASPCALEAATVDLRSGGPTVFFAASLTTGKRLWRTQGVPGSTWQVTSLASDPTELAALDRLLAFSAVGSGVGRELWFSDGTSGGTYSRDVNPGAGDSNPAHIVPLAAKAVFAANDGAHGAEVMVTDGTASGTLLVADLWPDLASSQPVFPHELNGKILYAAVGGSPWSELWATDGTVQGTTRISNLQAPTYVTPVGQVAFFTSLSGSRPLYVTAGTADTTRQIIGSFADPLSLISFREKLVFAATQSGAGNELWHIDPATLSAAPLKDLNPGPGSSNPRWMTVLSPTELAFTADDGVHGEELWFSDGTPAGTRMVADLAPGPASSSPDAMVREGATTYFLADNPNTGVELYAYRADKGGFLVRDIIPGLETSVPSMPVVFRGAVFLSAQDPELGLEIFRSDGTEAGTKVLVDLVPGPRWSYQYEFVVFREHLYISANDDVRGLELWRTDGTAAGTELFAEIYPGPDGSVPNGLIAIGDRLFFGADDGVHGRELWVSDGTRERTLMAQDISPGNLPSNPNSFISVGETLLFFARQPDGSDEVMAGDLSAPVVTPVVTGKLGQNGFYVSDVAVSFQVTGRSLLPRRTGCDPVSVIKDTAGTAFSCNAMGLGADGTGSVIVKRDATAPAVVCPKAPEPAEASSHQGALVVFSDAVALDGIDPRPAVTYAPGASASAFPVGQTTVTVTATDLAGNQGSCAFQVLVTDTAAPALSCQDVETEATEPAGTPVRLPTLAVDVADPSPAVVHTLESGLVLEAQPKFPVGGRKVFAEARDASGNKASCSFQVEVVDTTPPVVTCPAPRTVPADDAEGVTVADFGVTVRDNGDPAPQLSFDRPNRLPIGRNVIGAWAQDASENESERCEFEITVTDRTPPTVDCQDLVVEATGPDGAKVEYACTVTDNVLPPPGYRANPASGSLFPLGKTAVTATAEDAGDNEASDTFIVWVRDTTAPAVICPAEVRVDATGPDGAIVEYPEARATDAVTSSPTVRYSRESGSSFPTGTSVVTVRAQDAAGNADECRLSVTVVCGAACQGEVSHYSFNCSSASGPAGWAPAGLALLGLLLRRRRAGLVAALLLLAPGAARAEGPEDRRAEPTSAAPVLPSPAASAEAGPRPAEPAPAAAAVPKRKPRAAFLGVRSAPGVSAEVAAAVSEYLQSQLTSLGAYDVIGRSEIATMMGFDREKTLLGCSDDSCLAEIGFALAVDRIIAGDLARLEESYLLNLSLIDARKTRVISRVGRRVVGGSIELVLDAVRPTLVELVTPDPKRGEIAPLPREASFGGFFLGLRGDADLLGPGITVGLMAEYSGDRFGAAAALLNASPRPAVRLEGRYYLAELARARFFAAAGGTLIAPAVGARLAAGAHFRLDHIQVFLDAAYERFFNDHPEAGQAYLPNAFVLGFGGGWKF